MKTPVTLVFLFLFFSGCMPAEPPGPRAPLPPIDVYFSPKGGCTDAIVKQIDAAKRTILVQAYSFTSKPIAQALVGAHRRGVSVQVILDSKQATDKYSSADFLFHAGVPVSIDREHAIAHNKIVILDGEILITGSFNFSKQAEQSNAENVLVIHDRGMAELYTENWNRHRAHSEVFAGRR